MPCNRLRGINSKVQPLFMFDYLVPADHLPGNDRPRVGRFRCT